MSGMEKRHSTPPTPGRTNSGTSNFGENTSDSGENTSNSEEQQRLSGVKKKSDTPTLDLVPPPNQGDGPPPTDIDENGGRANPRDPGTEDQGNRTLVDDGGRADEPPNTGPGNVGNAPVDEARRRESLSEQLDGIQATIEGFMSEGLLSPTLSPLKEAMTAHAGADRQVKAAESGLVNARARVHSAELELQDENTNDERRERVEGDLKYYQGQVAQNQARVDEGIAPEVVQALATTRTAHDAFLNTHRTGFDVATRDLSRIERQCTGHHLDDLAARIDSLKRLAVRQRGKDKNVELGSMGDFAKSIGLDVSKPGPITSVHQARLDLRHQNFDSIGFALQRQVPGREGFVDLDTNRQVEHDPGTDDPWTGERSGNVDAQISALMAQLEDAWTAHQLQLDEMKEKDPNLDRDSVLSVFLGPEWFFGFVRVYNKHQKAQVVNAILKASKRFPGMLIAPGTILWSPDNVGILNTLPVVMNGSLIRELSKKRWGGDTGRDHSNFISDDHPDRRKWVRKEDESPFVTVGNMKIAIDICQDHQQAKAKQDMYGHLQPSNGVDLHLITSSGQTTEAYAAASKKGGHSLHTDSASENGSFFIKKMGDQSTHDTRELQDTGDYTDTGRGLVYSNTPLQRPGGDDSLGEWSYQTDAYDPGQKDDYKKYKVGDDPSPHLLRMLAYANDHIRRGHAGRGSRVRAMKEKAQLMFDSGKMTTKTLAKHVILKLQEVERL